MIFSGHQPVYLPGIIVFTKIALSDAFMYVRHCQYVSGSWHSRNFIRGVNDKPAMLLSADTEQHGAIDRRH